MTSLSGTKQTLLREPTTTQKVTREHANATGVTRLDVDLRMEQLQLKHLSHSQLQKKRDKAARSLLQRSDQESVMTIKGELAEAQGLKAKALERLKAVAPGAVEKTLQSIVDFLFSDENKDHSILQYKFSPASASVRDAVLAEARKIQNELEQLTRSETKHLRPSCPRDVQNSRFNYDNDGHVVFSTGQIETERKANQVLSKLIFETFNSKQLNTENLVQEDGCYIFPVVIENLMNKAPFSQKEQEKLRLANEVLMQKNGEKRSVVLPSGAVITIKLQLMHFSTHADYNEIPGQKYGLCEQITETGTAALREYYDKKKVGLKEGAKTLIEDCFTRLNTCSPSDRLFIRALICELLEIPYHASCNSSKDQTVNATAIKKALHLWMKVERWVNGTPTIGDVSEFFKSNIFREYTEAAFFEDLASTQQSFPFKASPLENPMLTRLLTDRHLTAPSILERLVNTTLASFASIAITLLAVAFSAVILSILAVKYKTQPFTAWTAWKYLLLALILLPAPLAWREKWLDRASSPLLQAQEIKPETAADLQEIYKQFNSLTKFEYQNILKFMQDGESTRLNPSHKQLLENVTKNWVVLQDASSVPSRVKALLAAAKKSPVLLFRLLTEFNQKKVMEAIKETHFFWPAENSSQELVRAEITNGYTEAFLKDIDRTDFIVHGKNKTYNSSNASGKEAKLELMKTALHDLSALSGEERIPYAVQQALSQKTEISTVLQPIFFSSIDINGLPPATHQTFILEEGDDSSFWMTVKQTVVIRNADVPESDIPGNPLSFENSYRLKISRSKENIWSTELVSMTPWYPVPGRDGLDPLLKLGQKDPVMSRNDHMYNVHNTMLSYDIDALAKWTPQSPIPIEDVHREMIRHFDTLSTHYIDKFIENHEKTVRAITAQYKKAKTEQGKKLLLQTLVSYLSLLTEAQIVQLDLPAGVLKAVLHPHTYQTLCVEKGLDATAEIIPALDGTIPIDRFSKELKYRYVFEQLMKHVPPLPEIQEDELFESDVENFDVEFMPSELDKEDPAKQSKLKEKCLALQALINTPQPDARVQYQMFVQQLRQALEIAPPEGTYRDWLNQIAMHRFASIKLHEYCKGLVEAATGPFDQELTLDTFWPEFEERNGRIKSMPSEYGFSLPARIREGLKSSCCYHFDPLAELNVPYVYGKLNVDGRDITVLRHGTPFHYHNPLSYSKRNKPDPNPDYVAFKSTPSRKTLHIILENGKKKIFSGEAARVQSRIDLQGENFHAIALRMNGDFVEPKHYAPKTIAEIKQS